MSCCQAEVGAGSSPLTRGKQAGARKRHGSGGLIPAHAGKTSSRRSAATLRRAHPRSRGENKYSRVIAPPWLGSSPLTRGKPVQARGPGLGAGLIPAHAGKTRRRAYPPRGQGAHPRSRGENANADAAKSRGQGSSPLTRGKPHLLRAGKLADGLIPAHAGKTNPDSSWRLSKEAHPRSRGENA